MSNPECALLYSLLGQSNPTKVDMLFTCGPCLGPEGSHLLKSVPLDNTTTAARVTKNFICELNKNNKE